MTLSRSQIAIGTVALLSISLVNIIMHLMKVNGVYQFKPVVAVFLIEFVKFGICVVVLTYQIKMQGRDRPVLNWPGDVRFAVPAFSYMIQNVLSFDALNYFQPPLVVLLGNMRIFWTALFFCTILNRVLSKKQLFSIVILFFGVVCSQWENDFSMNLSGFLIMTVICLLSGMGGVYTEFLMKTHVEPEQNKTLAYQNMRLYFFGIIFNFIEAVREIGLSNVKDDFFAGMTPINIFLIFLLAFNGLIISLVLKYLDSILKNFISSISVLLTTFLSYLFLGFVISPYFAVGVVLVSISVYLFNTGTIPSPTLKKEVILEEVQVKDKFQEENKST